MLTRKQHELLMFIHERVRESGIPPSFDEMKDALNLKSKSGIHRLITALVQRGFLRRLEKRARAIEILKLPENVADMLRPATTRTQALRGNHTPPARPIRGEPRAAADARSAGSPRRAADSDNAVTVPVLGRIAAGTPIDALQHKVSEMPVPGSILGRGGEHYALEVTGDSMINAGILDGDTVIIQQGDTASTGDIVVALVDETEATLKRLRRRGDSIALEAANPAYETRLYGADRIRVQGRLVGLIRRY